MADGGRAAADPSATTDCQPSVVERFRPYYLGFACALFVAQTLVPGEAAAAQGDGLPVAMLWIVLAGLWFGMIGQKSFRFRFGWIDAAFVVLVVWHAIAALWGSGEGSPRPAANMLWQWVGFGLSFLLVRQLVASGREARAVAVVMVALAVALSGYGLYQYFYEMPAGRAQYEHDPDQALKDAGVWYEPGSIERILFEKRLESTEPLGTFALANSMAGYLAPWLAVALGIGFCRQGAGSGRLRAWLAVAACVLPIALCLLLTKSRSAYLAAMVGLPLVWWCGRKQRASRWKPVALGLVVVVILAIAVVGFGGLDREVLSQASLSLGYRMQYWQASLAIVAESPVTGCGPGQFQNAYTVYKLPEASEEIADPHNFLMELWATAGTPAAVALLVVIGLFFRTVISSDRTARASIEQMTDEHNLPLTADATWGVLSGGAFGFLLSIPLGWLNTSPPGLSPVIVGLPLAVGAAALLYGWINHGRFPALLAAAGTVVLLVNLSAAGGIGYGSVAGTLWLLMALGLVAAESYRRRVAPRGVALALMFAAMLLAATCYRTAYSPVLACRAKMQLADRSWQNAQRQADVFHVVGQYEEAAAADPRAADPWSRLAEINYLIWRQEPTTARLGTMTSCQQGAIRRDPRSAAMHLAFADRWVNVFAHSKEKEHLQIAIDMYQKAAELYPNSALHRAKLAAALRVAGDETGYRDQADRALRLDEITPHADKKLPEELRNALKRNKPLENAGP